MFLLKFSINFRGFRTNFGLSWRAWIADSLDTRNSNFEAGVSSLFVFSRSQSLVMDMEVVEGERKRKLSGEHSCTQNPRLKVIKSSENKSPERDQPRKVNNTHFDGEDNDPVFGWFSISIHEYQPNM